MAYVVTLIGLILDFKMRLRNCRHLTTPVRSLLIELFINIADNTKVQYGSILRKCIGCSFKQV